MSRETFLRSLTEQMATGNAEEIDRVRRDVISRGKHSPKLINVAHAKGLTDDPKYFDAENTDDSGAISLIDAKILHALMKVLTPSAVIEFGTWFGTSAVTMARAIQGTVYTCDRHDVYVGDRVVDGRIVRHCGLSTGFLRYLARKRVRAQFVFIDAILQEKDVKHIRRVIVRGSVVALHDYEGDRKGVRNWKMVHHLFRELEMIRPEDLTVSGTNMALAIPKDSQ